MKRANVVKRAKKNLQNNISDGKEEPERQNTPFNDGKIFFLRGPRRA
ncbi:MAG: hypothetical protein IPP68_01360 [Elusimicrobia bacterium]|jgi:hypothetical protein|nr:hypothetical protein [Elusimicrobiota bacterium]